MPDQTTILYFPPLLERHGLARQLFEAINRHLQAKKLIMRARESRRT
ncbi:MAG: hypothetical protein KIS73_18395 [Enhydrobacter sp.]|nr:hypothetical protein [Enhydrobacter sp.]